jgi:hypothetical protein
LILSNPVQFTIHSSKRVTSLVAIVRVIRKKQKCELAISISHAEPRLSTTPITSEFVIKLYIHFLSINTRTRPHCPYGYFIAKCKTCCCAAAKCLPSASGFSLTKRKQMFLGSTTGNFYMIILLAFTASFNILSL